MLDFNFDKWKRGTLYRVYLVQRNKNLWNDYDYSNEWKKLEEVMEKDLHDDEVFLFHHPKFSKKEYKRKYHMCPANGNARMVVGRMENPLDFAYVFFVIHSYFYNVPYIVLEDYKCIFPNPDVIAEMVARAVNWVLKDFGVEIVLKRWDELVLYPIDFWVSYNKELRKSGGRNLIPMGYEGALKVHEAKEAKKQKRQRSKDNNLKRIKDHILNGRYNTIMEFLKKGTMGEKSPKRISMPFRLLLNREIISHIPYKLVLKEMPHLKGLVSKTRYNHWTNKFASSYDGDSDYEKMEKELNRILQK